MYLILFPFWLKGISIRPDQVGFYSLFRLGLLDDLGDRNSWSTWLTPNSTLLYYSAGHQARVVRIRNLLIPPDFVQFKPLPRWFLRCLSHSQLDQEPLYPTTVHQPRLYPLILLSTNHFLHHRVQTSKLQSPLQIRSPQLPLSRVRWSLWPDLLKMPPWMWIKFPRLKGKIYKVSTPIRPVLGHFYL